MKAGRAAEGEGAAVERLRDLQGGVAWRGCSE